jgi:DNA-binding CsgD family transcriptional regulator
MIGDRKKRLTPRMIEFWNLKKQGYKIVQIALMMNIKLNYAYKLWDRLKRRLQYETAI